MFETRPAEPVNEIDADLRARWLPSEEQIAAGVAALDKVPSGRRDRFVAVVGLAQPGKQYGFWQIDQRVVPVPGVWLAEITRGDEPTQHPYAQAMSLAERAAASWLEAHGETGTVAHVVINPDGSAAVFESPVTAASEGQS